MVAAAHAGEEQQPRPEPPPQPPDDCRPAAAAVATTAAAMPTVQIKAAPHTSAAAPFGHRVAPSPRIAHPARDDGDADGGFGGEGASDVADDDSADDDAISLLTTTAKTTTMPTETASALATAVATTTLRATAAQQYHQEERSLHREDQSCAVDCDADWNGMPLSPLCNSERSGRRSSASTAAVSSTLLCLSPLNDLEETPVRLGRSGRSPSSNHRSSYSYRHSHSTNSCETAASSATAESEASVASASSASATAFLRHQHSDATLPTSNLQDGDGGNGDGGDDPLRTSRRLLHHPSRHNHSRYSLNGGGGGGALAAADDDADVLHLYAPPPRQQPPPQPPPEGRRRRAIFPTAIQRKYGATTPTSTTPTARPPPPHDARRHCCPADAGAAAAATPWTDAADAAAADEHTTTAAAAADDDAVHHNYHPCGGLSADAPANDDDTGCGAVPLWLLRLRRRCRSSGCSSVTGTNGSATYATAAATIAANPPIILSTKNASSSSPSFKDPPTPSSHPQPRHRRGSHHRTRRRRRHAQALLLGAAFGALWSASNLPAPNLTAMATDFGITSRRDRDVYLGSVLSLATLVASLPAAAAVGFCADRVASRSRLWVAVLVVGAAASALTAASAGHYAALVGSRWLSGGCLAGSVPVAFSLLSDSFDDATERSAACSGLTAFMGAGILGGQVLAAAVQPWTRSFAYVAALQAVFAALCAAFLRDPVRGGQEEALRELLHRGKGYTKRLTLAAFYHAVLGNASNFILLWQGFFSSLPWGVMFCFLNDFLSQERGFSVPDATFLVAVFGIGCAFGGILGGCAGQAILERNRSYLPLFMAVTTAAGILPLYALLNSHFANARGWRGIGYALAGGVVASLPSVMVRPCLRNVNPPEARGAALTTANLLISLGRGVGPSCVTLLQSAVHDADRKFAFNVTIIVFWSVSALQLLLLTKTLPRDQDAMEAELALYAASMTNDHKLNDSVAESVNEIEERMMSFDDIAAQETLVYVRAGIQELRSPFHCSDTLDGSASRSNSGCCSSSDDDDDDDALDAAAARRDLWRRRRHDPDVPWTDETLLCHPQQPSPPPSPSRIVDHRNCHPTETAPLLA